MITKKIQEKTVLVTCKISISDTFAVTVLPHWASATRTAWCSWTSRASLKTLATLSWFSFLLRRTHMIVAIKDVRVDWEVTKSWTLIDISVGKMEISCPLWKKWWHFIIQQDTVNPWTKPRELFPDIVNKLGVNKRINLPYSPYSCV